MPIGTTFDQEVLAAWTEKEVKKESETTTTTLFDPDTAISPTREGSFRLTAFALTASAETVITLEDETTSIGSFLVAAKGYLQFVLPGQGYFSKAPGNELKIKSSNTAKISGAWYGREE